VEHPDTAAAACLDTVTRELARLEAELARYAEAMAPAGPLPTVLQAVGVREQRRDTGMGATRGATGAGGR